jgi:hypothetical protein
MNKSAKKTPVKRPAKKKTAIAPAIQPHARADVAVKTAIGSGKWLIAAFNVTGDKLSVDVVSSNFPDSETQLATRLFVETLEKLKGQ